MTILTEHPHTGSFILSLSDSGELSMENIIIAAGAGTLLPGTVLGKITATGKYMPCLAAAADGSQNAAGILYERVVASTRDCKVAAVVRLAEVCISGLIWPAGETDDARTAGLERLATRMIVAR